MSLPNDTYYYNLESLQSSIHVDVSTNFFFFAISVDLESVVLEFPGNNSTVFDFWYLKKMEMNE